MAKADDKNESDVIIIKKYANRRLYNTSKSCYVTLEHLSEMVREGDDFVVKDAKSGEDITRSVLTQIIFEEEAKGQNMLPTNFLRQLIRLYGDTLQGFVPSYLETSMDAFTNNQEKIREQVQGAFGGNPALSNFEAMTRTNMELFENAMQMFSPFGGGAPQSNAEAEKAEEKSEANEQSDLDDLKKQLSQMQEQLSKLAGGS